MGAGLLALCRRERQLRNLNKAASAQEAPHSDVGTGDLRKLMTFGNFKAAGDVKRVGAEQLFSTISNYQ